MTSGVANELIDATHDACPLTMRHKIKALEDHMLTYPQVPIETKHYFAEGLYAREIFIPKGTLLTGAVHLFEHINILSQGDITIILETGAQRLKAPQTIVSKPGTKRVGYAHEDTVWTTIHAAEETDIKKLEELLVVKSHAELTAEQFKQIEEALCLTT